MYLKSRGQLFSPRKLYWTGCVMQIWTLISNNLRNAVVCNQQMFSASSPIDTEQFAAPFGPSLSDYRFAQNDLYCTYVLERKIVCDERRETRIRIDVPCLSRVNRGRRGDMVTRHELLRNVHFLKFECFVAQSVERSRVSKSKVSLAKLASKMLTPMFAHVVDGAMTSTSSLIQRTYTRIIIPLYKLKHEVLRPNRIWKVVIDRTNLCRLDRHETW